MRDVKIEYIVLHTRETGVRERLEPAVASADFRLLARFDDDYLFQVLPTDQRAHGDAAK
jgi:hypothetical protein